MPTTKDFNSGRYKSYENYEVKLLDKEKVVVLWNTPSPAEKNRNFGRFDCYDGE